ncbi:hypothetical protein DFH06DRAFT_1402512 [Mycena polygramma]|nr:hypothetical protein DFH06DRAFT_1402512 [Mycena polygramma]
MPHKPTMSLSMPEYTPELEYSLDLGAEASAPSTPQPPPPPRARNWRPAGHEREQQARSTAYDSEGNLKVAMRGRRAAERDCGIWCVAVALRETKYADWRWMRSAETAVAPWIYAPASTGLCPACDAPCVLPPSRPRSPSPSASAFTSALSFAGDANILDTRGDTLRRPRTPPASRATSHSPSRPAGAGSVLVQDESSPAKPKYTRPGADALVRLLSVVAALVLLLGAMSRRGGADVAVPVGEGEGI